MSRLAAAVFLGITLGSAVLASAAPLDDVRAALAAEKAAPSVRAVLKLEKRNVITVFVVERVAPDRLRVVFNPEQAAQEIVVIGDATYWRGPAGWKRTPSPRAPAVVPTMEGLLSTGLRDVTEQVPSEGRRNYSGMMSWSNGGQPCEGRLNVVVSVASGLPERLIFEGTCDGTPCRFAQTFAYDPALRIDVPR